MLKSNKIIIVSGASGAGKTTLVKHLLLCPELNLEFSISACSRKKRIFETNGKDYIFLSVQDFKSKIESGDFLEWEEVYREHFYGTLKASTIEILNSGKNILFDVDVHGANSIKNFFKNRAISIFIQAPSIAVAKERLTNRKTESKDEIDFRVKKIEHETWLGQKMDYQLINNELEDSKETIYNVVKEFLKS